MHHTSSFHALGSTRQAIIERDLAHIERVLMLAPAGARDNSAFPPSYWSERLRRIKDGGQLWGTHLQKIDTLQRILGGALPPG
jgi:hypothetical protein